MRADAEPAARWRQLVLLSATVLLVLGNWFSGSAVAPSLADAWGIDQVGIASLTVAVQLGFAITAVALASTDAGGWRLAFAVLAVGPALGIVAMWRLRRRPDAVRMANGKR